MGYRALQCFEYERHVHCKIMTMVTDVRVHLVLISKIFHVLLSMEVKGAELR
jgi:hypothetical protein